MMAETLRYRVAYVGAEGERFYTVALDSYDYAVKLWENANDLGHVARCWIERQPVGEWDVCSSETGSEFMALKPRTAEMPGEGTLDGIAA